MQGFAQPYQTVVISGYSGTSITPLAIAMGPLTFTTQAGLAYLTGARARASSNAGPTNYVEGIVTSYSGTTLVLDVDTVGGSGTVNDWNFNISGNSAGSAGAQLADQNTFTNVQAVQPVIGTIAGSVAIDLSDASANTGFTPTGGQPTASNNLYLTATANVTALTVANPVDGAVYNLYLIENGTGGWTWPSLPASFLFGAAGSPTLTTSANAINLISLQWIAALSAYKAVCSPG